MRCIKRLELFFMLAFAVVLVPCYGQNTAQVNNIQANGGLVIIGVSGRFSNRNQSIAMALTDAARKLSFFNSVTASSVNIERFGISALDVNIDSSYQLRYDEELEKFLDRLEFNPKTDVFENNNAVFVITKVASNVSMPAFRGHSFDRKKPSWIDNPPAEIDGFIAGVGFSGRLSSHRDTVIKSYEKAVVSIIENIEVKVQGDQFIWQDNSFLGFLDSSSNETHIIGTLQNFYVIESWTDPSNLSVWTLAVAKRR